MFTNKKWYALHVCVSICLLLTILLCSSASATPKTQGISINVDTDRYTLTVLSQGVALKQYPVAVGKPQTPTPIGQWQVINKYKNWGSGFGSRWIGLNVPWGTYGIHGTNKPFSIGRNMSSGCIRMHNNEVEALYDWVTIGTPVVITGHPLRHLKPLSVGNVGMDVWLVQDRLTRLGFYHGKIDGRFGIKTETAVKNFEQKYGLPIDGVVGLREYKKLGLEE